MQESKKSPEQVEQERFTRRQALRKFGFGAGLSAFMLLGVDDLARMVGQKMQQMDGDNKVADKVAREFQRAGIAFAAGPSGCAGQCNGDCTCICNCNKTNCVAGACSDYPGCCDSNNVPNGTCTGGFAFTILGCENTADNCVLNCPDEIRRR